MDSKPLWAEKLARNLVEGQEFTAHLQTLIKKSYGDDGSIPLSSCHEVLPKILRSFNESLAILTSLESSGGGQQLICQNIATSQVDSACCEDWRSEDSGESKKRQLAAKDRRGCYKRKKNVQTWNTVSSTIEDGQAWRKYGQKEILHSKHPRSYFRCTRKYDQGCKATKQVQRMEDNPQKYNITYIGHHTCKGIIVDAAPQVLITDSSSDHANWESCNFMVDGSDSKKFLRGDHHQQFTITTSTSKPITTASVKQEPKEEHHHQTPTSDVTDNVSSLDCDIIWEDLMKPAFDNESMMSVTEATSHRFSIFQNCDFSFDETEIFM